MAARNLDEALAGMSYSLDPGTFVLVGFADEPGPLDLAALREAPSQLIREAGETSMLVRKEALAGLRSRHLDLRSEGPLLWIRFDSPMGWEVVGFLARVTEAMASAGIPIGAVCSYSRDHLFVNTKYEAAVLRTLSRLFPRGA